MTRPYRVLWSRDMPSDRQHEFFSWADEQHEWAARAWQLDQSGPCDLQILYELLSGGCDRTRDLRPTKFAAVGEETAAARAATPVPRQQVESAAARSAGVAATFSEVRVVEAADATEQATAVRSQFGERLAVAAVARRQGGFP